MKRVFTFIILSQWAVLSAQSQAVTQPAPDSLTVQPIQSPPVIQPINGPLMAQLAHEHQLTQAKLLAQLDKRNGFRDVTFGTHLKFFKKVVLEWKEGDDRNYRRVTDQLAINGMPLSEIVYGFHQSRLQHIYLTAPGIENSRRMLQFFQSIYGAGERVYDETIEFDNMIQWTGSKVILTYSEVASKKEGFFHFFVVDGEIQANVPKPNGKKNNVPKSTGKKALGSKGRGNSK
jgi:hypothetical protein